MNIDYVLRSEYEDNIITDYGKNIHSTRKLLKKEYPYIYNSMKKENYKIEYDHFNLIVEIVDEEKVVGIISLDNIEDIEQTLCINEAYIMPEFRHKKLFYHNLMNLLFQPNTRILIKNPNRKIINLLMDYKLAKKMSNNIVLSYIGFYVEYSQIYKNKKIREYYHRFEKHHQKNNFVTEFYDLNINSSVFFDVDNIFEFNENPPFIEKARMNDSKKDYYYRKLKNVDLIYLNLLLQKIRSLQEEIPEFMEKTKEYLYSFLTIEDVLGRPDAFTYIFEELLDNYDLDTKDGNKILKKISLDLAKEEITPRSIIVRTWYYIQNLDKIDKAVDKSIELGLDIEEECPYCSTLNFSIQETCSNCGYNLQKNNYIEENMTQIIGKHVLTDYLIPECKIKYKLDLKQDKLNSTVFEDLSYTSYDKRVVYEVQSKVAAYELLKNINEQVYFEIFNYDALNLIRNGSAFDYAIKNGLITELKNYKNYFEFMEIFYSNDDLKNILKRNNLKKNGTREEMIHRIKVNLSPLNIFGKKYILTDKGSKFLQKHEYYENYINNFSSFLFYEYLEFQKEYTGPEDEFNNSFIKHMEDIAVVTDDYYKYHDVLLYRLEHTGDDIYKYLIFFTQLFIIDINFWLNEDFHEEGEKPLSFDVMEGAIKYKDYMINDELLNIYEKAQDNIKIKNLKNNDDITLLYLIKLVQYEDIDDINRELEYDNYEKKFIKEILKD